MRAAHRAAQISPAAIDALRVPKALRLAYDFHSLKSNCRVKDWRGFNRVRWSVSSPSPLGEAVFEAILRFSRRVQSTARKEPEAWSPRPHPGRAMRHGRAAERTTEA